MNRTPPMPPITQRWDRLIDASKFVILQKVQMVDAIGATANYAWQKQTTKARTILRRTVKSESQWRYDELHTVLICPSQMKAVLYSSRYSHWMCLDRIFFVFATAWKTAICTSQKINPILCILLQRTNDHHETGATCTYAHATVKWKQYVPRINCDCAW